MASFPVTLSNQPSQQFRLFYRAVVAAYGAACTTVYQHGLLGFIVDDIQWEQLPGTVVLNDEPNLPNQIVPRPTVTIPPISAANCTTLTVKVWERRVSDHLILSRYVYSNIVANIVTNIYMYVMRHVRKEVHMQI